MLTSNVAFAQQYDYSSTRFQKAFHFLKTADLKNLPVGNVEIDGREVYASIQEYVTLKAENAPFESHRNYFDVQYVVDGEEAFGYTPKNLCRLSTEYDASCDLIFYQEPEQSSCIILKAGDFAIVSPEEAHAPRRQTANGACNVKKIVVKVKV